MQSYLIAMYNFHYIKGLGHGPDNFSISLQERVRVWKHIIIVVNSLMQVECNFHYVVDRIKFIDKWLLTKIMAAL